MRYSVLQNMVDIDESCTAKGKSLMAEKKLLRPL